MWRPIISQYESPNIVIVPTVSADSKKSNINDKLQNKLQVTDKKIVPSAGRVKEKQSSSQMIPYATQLFEPNSLKSQYATPLLDLNSRNVQTYDQCSITKCKQIPIDQYYPCPFDLPIQPHLVPYINKSQYLRPIHQNNVMETSQNISEYPYLVPVQQNMVIYQNSFQSPLLDSQQNVDAYQNHLESPMLEPNQQNMKMYHSNSESPFIAPIRQNMATYENAFVCPYVKPAQQNLDTQNNSKMPIQQNIETYKSSVKGPFIVPNQENMEVPMSIQQNSEAYPSNVGVPLIVPNQQTTDVPKQSEMPIQNGCVQVLDKSLLSKEIFNKDSLGTSSNRDQNKNCQLKKNQNKTKKKAVSSWASNYLQSIGQNNKKAMSLNLLSIKPRKTAKRASTMKSTKNSGIEMNAPTPNKAPGKKVSSTHTEKISDHERLKNKIPLMSNNSIYQSSFAGFNSKDSKASQKDTANSNIKDNADQELFHNKINTRIDQPHSPINLNSKEPKFVPNITEKTQTKENTSDHGSNKTPEKLVNSNSMCHTHSSTRDMSYDTKMVPIMKANSQIKEKIEVPVLLNNKELKTNNKSIYQPHSSTREDSKPSTSLEGIKNAKLSQHKDDSQFEKHENLKFSSHPIRGYKEKIKNDKTQTRDKYSRRKMSKYLTPDRTLKSKRDSSTSSRDYHDDHENIRKKRKITDSEAPQQQTKNSRGLEYEHKHKSCNNHKKHTDVTAQRKREKIFDSTQSSDDFEDANKSIIINRRKIKYPSDLKSKNTQTKSNKNVSPSRNSDSSEDSDDFLKNYQKIQSNFSSFSSDIKTKKIELLKELLDRELKKRSYNSKESSKPKKGNMVSSVNKTTSKNKNVTAKDKNKVKSKNKIENNLIETPLSSSNKNGKVHRAILKSKQCTIIKSIVEVTQNFEFRSPPKERQTEKFDLRTKLSHKSLNEYFNKMCNTVNKEHTKKMPMKHENLIITVPNDKEDDEEMLDIKDMGPETKQVELRDKSPKINKSKTEEVKSPSKIKLPSPKRGKFKKINLILNVVREKSLSSSNTDDECEDKEDDCISISSQGSITRLLDNFNVDEIVESSHQFENDYNLTEKSVEEPSKTNDVQESSNNAKFALLEKSENKFNVTNEKSDIIDITRNVTSLENDNPSFVNERLFSQIKDKVKDWNETISVEQSVLTSTNKVENCKNRDILAKQSTLCLVDIKVEASDEHQEEKTDIVVLDRNETKISAGNLTKKSYNVNEKEITNTDTSLISVEVETEESSKEVKPLISLRVGISNASNEGSSQSDTETGKESETVTKIDMETSVNEEILNNTIKKTIPEPIDIKVEYCTENANTLKPVHIKQEPPTRVENVEAMASSTYGDITNMSDDTNVQNIRETVSDVLSNKKHTDRMIHDGKVTPTNDTPDNINIKTKVDLNSHNQFNVSSNKDVSDQNPVQSVNRIKEYINKQSKIENIEQQESDIVKRIYKTASASVEHKCRSDDSDENMTMPLKASDTVFLGDIEERIFGYLHERYTLKSVLSRGRFSYIYKCEDSRHEKYALKIIKKEYNRFNLGVEKEKMLVKLQKDIPKDHYNCVFLVNGFGHSGVWCFLMEYYPKNLKQALLEETRPFHIDQVQFLARQLVAAVMTLRNNKVVHSDIAPRHILLNSSNERLKLCGFDRSYYIVDVNPLPSIGTASYRAPEIILGHSAGYSLDVWSTALVIYEMATKLQRFPGVYNNDILYKQMCVLGHMPTDMIEESLFGRNHFIGTTFLRRIGPKGQNVRSIKKFYQTPQLHTTILKVYSIHWKPIRSGQERVKDYAKLSTFSNLLHAMLVLHPKQRVPIEAVCDSSFIDET